MASRKQALLAPGLSKYDSNIKNSAYVVLSGAAGKSLGSVFMGSCPLVSIDVDSQVDVSLVNALNNDLYVNTFGYAPVNIQMSGLEIHRMCQKKVTSNVNKEYSIGKFFADNNVHKDPKARVDVSIRSASGDTQTYRCVVISLKHSGDGHPKSVGMSGYELKLAGIRL